MGREHPFILPEPECEVSGAGSGECRDKFDLSDVYVYVSLFSQMFARDTVTRLWQTGAVLTSCLSP